MGLKEGHFTSIEKIQGVVTTKLKSISKEEFFKVIKRWKDYINMYITPNRDYFE